MNKVTVYESFTGNSTGTFLKDHINTAFDAKHFVFYIDVNDGFSKYGIDQTELENLCVFKNNTYTMLYTLFNRIINEIYAGEASPCSIIIDHFEMIEVEHPSQKNLLLKLLHDISKYAPVVITSIGKIDVAKITSMPSNVMCCDYNEVDFNV